ncbi:hypothetical protein [Fluviicola taffensis]|uniref:AAA family ATPase n=1 Tax=Fluviicola taffensis TaxID=191579 RepID=UPI003137769C
MKILKLEISNVRGIPHLIIEPNGKSLVVYGANGVGKSAVIDAIDFLLTGKIARLLGEGTDDVSLKKHGPHIDKVEDASNVYVRASIKVHGVTTPIEIFRCMTNPNELVYDNKYSEVLTPLLDVLNRGQHVFTRREVLKLITAKSSDRSLAIGKILKLENLEEKRKALVSVKNFFSSEAKNAKANLGVVQGNINIITGLQKFDKTSVLKFINEQRVKLGSTVLEVLASETLKENVTRVAINEASVDKKSLLERATNLNVESLSSILSGVPKANKTLIEHLREIKSDPEAEWNVKRFEFTKNGKQLIRDSGECPLCDHQWLPGELELKLQSRIEAQKNRQNSIEENANYIKEAAKQVLMRIDQLAEASKPIGKNEEALLNDTIKRCVSAMGEWRKTIEKIIDVMSNPFEKYIPEDFEDDKFERLYSPSEIQAELPVFVEQMQTIFPEATPEQIAWDNLTKLEEQLKNLEETTLKFNKASVISTQATTLHDSFVSARDGILENLYLKIKDRFVTLYKQMHGDDEAEFEANFEAKDKALNMNVDFYGRGFHPPHALHSEGHQDSMGVCLFLALSEHLNTGLIDLITLDDVVTSVDAGHRRSFCDVLVKNFSNQQFIITTHETAWANQLKSSGVVQSKQMLKFYNWDVSSGPRIHYEADMWTRIDEDLQNDDVSAASAKLRRGMEEFLRYVCHSLKAPVPYSLEDSGGLGDFISPAIGRYNDLLKKAKESSRSWGKDDITASLNEIGELNKTIFENFNSESASVNKAVHFNQWASFTKQDFQPVVEAYKSLYSKVFSCENESCQSVLYLSGSPVAPEALRCKCGNTNWNLTKK